MTDRTLRLRLDVDVRGDDEVGLGAARTGPPGPPLRDGEVAVVLGTALARATLAAAVLMLAAGPLHRFGVIGWQASLGLFVAAALLAGFGRPADPAAETPTADPAELRSPVPGTLVRWLVDDGADVGEGDPVAVLDAMKMETTVAAHRAGILSQRAELAAMIPADAVLALIS